MRSPFWLGLGLIAALAFPRAAHAQILDHSNPSIDNDDLVANQSYAWGPIFLGGLCRLTDKGTDEAASVFSRKPVNITQFETSFVFQILSGGPGDTSEGAGNCADGLTFTIQNQGPEALGGSGGSLGYAGIGKSVCVKFDTVPNPWENAPDPSVSSTGLYVLGETPGGGMDLLEHGVKLRSQHPFRVDMDYNGRLLRVQIADLTTGAAARQTYTVDIPKIVGGPAAYVGFTAATGLGSSAQDIDKWYFASSSQWGAHSQKHRGESMQAAQRRPGFVSGTMVAAWPMVLQPRVKSALTRVVRQAAAGSKHVFMDDRKKVSVKGASGLCGESAKWNAAPAREQGRFPMWMCDRCQAINDDDVTRCPKCGWEQPKAEAAAPPAAGPNSTAPPVSPQSTSAAPVAAPPAAGADNRAAALTGGLLSPSEMMLFQGDRFVGAASPMGVRAPLIGRQTEVPNAALARVAMAVAFIANEHAGALRFSVDQQKGMLGLSKASALYVRPTDIRPEWPAGSLEALLVSMLGVPTKAGEIVYALVAADAAFVESEVLGQIADALRERGILEWENPNLPGLSWSTNVLTEYGQLVLERSVIAPVEALVSGFRRNKAETWKLLDREIATAFQRRHV